MADVTAKLHWTGDGLAFDAQSVGGISVLLDGDGAAGVSPVTTLLLALAGCMAADVVDIGTKMRLPITGLELAIAADRKPEPPRRLTAVRLAFTVQGVAAGDEARLRRAIDMSRDTYCSVLHSLRDDIEFDYELELR